MATLRALLLGLAVITLAAGPALAKGGGGGGGGGAGGGGGNGGGPAASGGQGNGNANGHGLPDGTGSGHTTGAGRGTAVTAPGSQHRSSTATQRLSTPSPGKAAPPTGVRPGMGRIGTVPTTPGHAP
jgi:hypothetical protein